MLEIGEHGPLEYACAGRKDVETDRKSSCDTIRSFFITV